MTDPVPTSRRGHDAPHEDGSDRYAIYVIWRQRTGRNGLKRRRLAETSETGLGACLRTLYDEDEITEEGQRVGIFDRETRRWLINPWAGTSPHI